ncbi:leucine-rich repeat domain-containing protein [Frigoriglobus tundricola]|uniref:Alanyl-tRNA synthetase n=1 Tax=Frigoriglobus tundricola TaxID=2774151 RepID=A0A6M5YTW4_9BACT|nr:hypothetical protein [Frigoriglobus tundricola]QJW96763.1 Alanyl-tRNA synthetase [Frigoriglobus tundricola]
MSRRLLCGIVTWLVLSSPQARTARADDAEDKALALVEKLGFVIRNDKLPDQPVIGLVLVGKVRDADLKDLVGFKQLTHLDLGDCAMVTDAGLKDLAPHKRLTYLSLRKTKVTDAGIKDLSGLKTLTKLDLDGTEVTDAGVRELQKALPKCKIIK